MSIYCELRDTVDLPEDGAFYGPDTPESDSLGWAEVVEGLAEEGVTLNEEYTYFIEGTALDPTSIWLSTPEEGGGKWSCVFTHRDAVVDAPMDESSEFASTAAGFFYSVATKEYANELEDYSLALLEFPGGFDIYTESEDGLRLSQTARGVLVLTVGERESEERTVACLFYPTVEQGEQVYNSLREEFPEYSEIVPCPEETPSV